MCTIPKTTVERDKLAMKNSHKFRSTPQTTKCKQYRCIKCITKKICVHIQVFNLSNYQSLFRYNNNYLILILYVHHCYHCSFCHSCCFIVFIYVFLDLDADNPFSIFCAWLVIPISKLSLQLIHMLIMYKIFLTIFHRFMFQYFDFNDFIHTLVMLLKKLLHLFVKFLQSLSILLYKCLFCPENVLNSTTLSYSFFLNILLCYDQCIYYNLQSIGFP